ncbi:hypothetical protein T4B_11933 [Trichinella pseudospiralis]|uniref:FLYWCH-type domain-containing protein n=1 Tax=Trichinella pseudospiralis TaxID=6337 RepID=A0A0V1JH69_TRIPS|nr:hypothetical protein T4A_12324 [Trichinella pseudospiralis]KRZ34221.1 hypothetical protein T4B_11933 [Trichinella pseudospiralis]KRZ45808.1 hypothetical protein T4C_1262 [Trichinella pseudospiralis]
MFLAFVMADIPELCLVLNRCGGMSLVHEGRAFKLKRADRKKYWKCSKQSAEETKPIPAIYDEEASAAST